MGSGFMSMDNPEYILNNNNAGNNHNSNAVAPDYHTLGIPLMQQGQHSPGGGSSEPSSLQSLPAAAGTGYSSLSSNTTSSMVTAINPYGVAVPRPPAFVATSDSGQADGSSSARSSVELADADVDHRRNAFTPPAQHHETTV
jgi:hypothetical protein